MYPHTDVYGIKEQGIYKIRLKKNKKILVQSVNIHKVELWLRKHLILPQSMLLRDKISAGVADAFKPKST